MEEADIAPLAIGELPLQATPDGSTRVSDTESCGQFAIKRIARNGGILVNRVVALQAGELPLDRELIDPQGYVVVLLLWGSAMVGCEYVEAPYIAALRPGCSMPELHDGAEAIFISLGPADKFNSESRLKFSLSTNARMNFSLPAQWREHCGQSKRVMAVRPSDDLHLWVQSAGGNEEEPREHRHPSGGEVVIMLDGLLFDRGGWNLGPFDVLAYGPNSSHGPRVGPKGAMALTLTLGTQED